jgi:phenylpyruvate tautomerase PptA (4-oxalocrotonate tautomerase family)
MPVSYIDVPSGISPAGKEKLVKDVFDAIHDAYPIPDTRVLVREWLPESVGQDGKIDLQPMRPICALEVPPGLPVAHKRRLVERISAAISEACRLPKHEVPLPSGTVVTTHWVLTFFREYPLENAALDGLLASENPMVLEAMRGAARSPAASAR